MKPVSTKEYKETIKALLAFVKSIAPKLQEVAKKREFELVITNDENGIGMSCTMGWDPLKDDDYDRIEVLPENITDEELSKIEKESIVRILQLNGWCRKLAADALGLSTRTLNRKIKKYGIKK